MTVGLNYRVDKMQSVTVGLNYRVEEMQSWV